MQKFRQSSKKVIVGIAGGFVLLVGLILIPYPGPGWLIVFAGLAILATEFTFAAKALHFAKGKYEHWTGWLKKQNIYVQLAVLSFTGLVVAVTVWLLNGFGIINNILDLGLDWVVSPLFR